MVRDDNSMEHVTTKHKTCMPLSLGYILNKYLKFAINLKLSKTTVP
jgi:hypothetical protein